MELTTISITIVLLILQKVHSARSVQIITNHQDAGYIHWQFVYAI